MIRLSVPGTLLYRDVVLRVVASACRLIRCHPSVEQEAGHRPHVKDFDDEVVSAAGEAFNNVAIHAYGARTLGTAELEIELQHDQITIRLSDVGTGFDPDAELPPDLKTLPESHMGLLIVRSFMDEVTYRRGSPPAIPNVMILRKRYFTSDIAETAD